MAKKEAPAPEGERNSSNSIFWRTFLMLMVLIVVSVLGGLQTYWTLMKSRSRGAFPSRSSR